MNRYTISFLFCLLFSAGVSAQASDVAINGVILSQKELAQLEKQLRTEILPGRYLVNVNNGCWMNLDSGAQGCVPSGQGGTYVGRGGSGEWNRNGDWSYRSNPAGMGVGGTGDGCIYAGDWSNC
ncbi:MAG: hypothetical protein SV765_06015 [Pseudomonadota bacterium]|nr:hypothetical protein [Pseudomonadales bacterium]MDY6919753.1 hypothetical protein [Pseudomonadota bacterium]